MRVTSNIILKGDAWGEAIEKLKPIISTMYGVYVISVAIGVYFDKQIENLEIDMYSDKDFEINRLQLETQTIELLFRAAIITTENVDFSEDIRMELAFSEEAKSDKVKGFSPMGFLTKFANYGVAQMAKRITDDPLDNIEMLNKYMTECVAGIRFDDIDTEEVEILESDIIY